MDSTTQDPTTTADAGTTADPAQTPARASAPSPTDTNYFTDDANVSDTRSQDKVVLSSVDDALAAIETFRASTAVTPWTSLDRGTVADRLAEIVKSPRAIYQGSLNLCGPAAFFTIVAGRHPLALAQAAASLYDTGTCVLGGLNIAPKSDLVSANYADMRAKMTSVAQQADWMLLGALRNTTAVFWQPDWTGDPQQEVAGMTRPEEIAGWFASTGFFATVTDGGKWATNPGIPAASSLATSAGYDNALLINAKMLSTAKKSTSPTVSQGQSPTLVDAGFGPDTQSFILSGFPNHWVVLLNAIGPSAFTDAAGNAYVTLSIWTWGASYLDLWIPQDDFVNNYYGAATTYITN